MDNTAPCTCGCRIFHGYHKLNYLIYSSKRHAKALSSKHLRGWYDHIVLCIEVKRQQILTETFDRGQVIRFKTLLHCLLEKRLFGAMSAPVECEQ